MARSLFVDFGKCLSHVGIDLGACFSLRHHTRILNSVYKLVTVWGPNIDWIEISIPVEVMKRLSPHIFQQAEIYNPKYSEGKVSKLRHLGIIGLTGPYFPQFSMDMIRSSPKLSELVLEEIPPPRWRIAYFGNPSESQKNVNFLEELSQANGITSKLTEFTWTLKNELERDLFFDPLTEQDRAGMAAKLAQIQFGRLEVLELDASVLGKQQSDLDSLKLVLQANLALQVLRFEPCSQDTPLTIIVGNQDQMTRQISLNVTLIHLKHLCIDSIKGQAVNLFTTVSHLPNLEVLEVRKRDPNHFIFYLNQSCFFREQFSLKAAPHTSLKMLAFEYPLEKLQDLHAVFDSFPNLVEFESPLCFGDRFLFGPIDIIGDVSFMESNWKIHNVLVAFARKIKNLKILRVLNQPELHLVSHWVQAFKVLQKLKGLQELHIDCRHIKKHLYVGRLRDAVRNRKVKVLRIRVLPDATSQMELSY
ncbi:uncharacterized protein LOC118434437 [Folsomia candida]|uniref:uncharacterized protein LOC118434437 n=1 Tax=Folsomia candida TaxID=158441 RepID=UPI001604E8CB|nr:uncharacterized protein LOC118434437 [Folsomia candida]